MNTILVVLALYISISIYRTLDVRLLCKVEEELNFVLHFITAIVTSEWILIAVISHVQVVHEGVHERDVAMTADVTAGQG